jgi:septum site-determining protein MinC
MHDGNVSIKGTKDGLLISLDSAEEWQLVINDLTARIDGNSAFFAGARITVDVGSRPIPKYALRTLKAALERRGLTLSNDLRASFSGRGGSAPAAEQAETAETLPIKSEEDVLTGVMIRKTLRSGRTIHSEGHVVVLGDVNPGAEVIAGGDVVIWGVLRGNVHAGAYGNESSVVCALDMMPTQLRIAGVLYEPPRGAKRTKSAPEIASVRSNQIIMDSWNR